MFSWEPKWHRVSCVINFLLTFIIMIQTEKDVKILLYEMVEQGELQCDCPNCDCQLVVTSDF